MTAGQPTDYAEENYEELVGGIRNALDRGEEINKAKQSFINAGYTKKEIDEATAALGISDQTSPVTATAPIQLKTPVSATPQDNKKPLIKKLPQVTSMKLPHKKIVFPSKKETQKLPVAQLKEPQKLNKALVIVLILLGILFVVAAGFFGIYWDQLFGPF